MTGLPVGFVQASLCPIVELMANCTLTPSARIRSQNAFWFANSLTNSGPGFSSFGNAATMMPSLNAPGFALTAGSIFSGHAAKMRCTCAYGSPAVAASAAIARIIPVFFIVCPSQRLQVYTIPRNMASASE